MKCKQRPVTFVDKVQPYTRQIIFQYTSLYIFLNIMMVNSPLTECIYLILFIDTIFSENYERTIPFEHTNIINELISVAILDEDVK